MAINNTITVTGYDPATGVARSLRGTGPTRAAALAELVARAKLTVMVTLKGSESTSLPADDFATVVTAAGEFADAELTLSKGVGYTDKVIRISNMSKVYRIAGSKGLVNLGHADILAFATAYYDGDGVNGYIPTAGHFVE